MTMRILHITPTYWPAIGGIENFVKHLCINLNASGVHADVAHVAPGLRAESEEHQGILVKRLPLFGHFLAGLAPGLVDAVQGYDLLHVHDPQLLSLTGSVKAFASGKPAVLSTHGGFHHTKKFAFAKAIHVRWLMPRMLSRYRLILADSQSDFDYFSRFANHVVLAECGVEVNRFAAIAPEANRSVWNWIYWGRLSRNKRLDLVLDLVAKARQLGYPVTLTVTGKEFDGTGTVLQERLTPEVAPLVNLLGPLSDEDLAQLIARSGVFVTASEHEGFGLSVIEAMAAGLVVICRDMSPLNSFVDEGCGLLLSFDGSEGDETKLKAFLDGIEQRYESLQIEGRMCAQRYDWKTAIHRFLDLYQTALRME